jgi:hypothetical protein
VKARTDNITVSGSFAQLENRNELFTKIVLTRRPILFRKQNYNNTIFPNAFLTPRTAGGGTFILSKNLKYSLVGCKSLESIEISIRMLQDLLQA